MKSSNLRHLLFVLVAVAILSQLFRFGPEPGPRSQATPSAGRPGEVSPTPESQSSSEEVDLSGVWMSNDRALCTVKQDGAKVTWEAISSYDQGKTFSHTFQGELDGDVLSGSFFDHPPGMNKNSGDLTFRVVGQDRFELVKAGGNFGGRVFTRQDT